ncbi:MAG TPA: hypothetical protein VHJ19_07695, partial [Gammaproteobacteria bacterium]|nr:hypothetical protein [Gammaproteobacteria bacterium]
ASVKLCIVATSTNTNRLRVFTAPELSIETLLASICLPQLRQALEINGDYDWDGGYMGNPVLETLVRFCESNDIIIVQINPNRRDGLLSTAPQFGDRVNDITFDASLLRELRSMAFITQLVEPGEIKDPHIQRAYFHQIADEEKMPALTLHSKLATDWPLLLRLRESSRRCADQWLEENFVHLGKRSTLDLKAWAPDYYRGPGLATFPINRLRGSQNLENYHACFKMIVTRAPIWWRLLLRACLKSAQSPAHYRCANGCRHRWR